MFKPSKKMIKESYSQCGEDLIIKFIFNNIGIKTPTYLDIGAHHPFYLSNTALFYDLGCRGINIEPDPKLFKEFVKYRSYDINLNIGIDNKSLEQDFFVMNVPTLNTFSRTEAEKLSNEGDYYITKMIKIKTENIQDIILQYAGGRFPHFLNIDAEGIDDIIINSIDFNENFPIIICVETISFSTSGKGIKNKTLIEKIISSGYVYYADTYINSIFVRKEKWIR